MARDFSIVWVTKAMTSGIRTLPVFVWAELAAFRIPGKTGAIEVRNISWPLFPIAAKPSSWVEISVNPSSMIAVMISSLKRGSSRP